MIRVTANEYLDRRQASWLDAEMLGRVAFNKAMQCVEIKELAIERAFAVQVQADIRARLV